MTDYKSQLQAKIKEIQELSQQFTQLQQQSNEIINDLEQQVKQLKRKNQMLTRQINQQKQKSKCFKSSIQREVQLAQRQRNQFKKKFMEFEKKVIQLQIVNENLQSQLRATKSTLSQYESRTEKTMEELAIARLQIEQTNESNKQAVTRLRNQLKQAQQQLYAIHQIKTKNEEQKEKNQNNIAKSQIVVSEITATNTNLFKQTLKGIRQYMGTLDSRKYQIRKLLLKA